jgi:hypothetical protein
MEDLDKLAADFVAGGCEPADTELADSESAAHDHGEGGPARTYGHGDTVRHLGVLIDGYGLPRPSAVRGSIRGGPDPDGDRLSGGHPEDLRAAFRAAQEEE